MPHDSTSQPSERLAQALGWFSIALGAAELAAPSRLARLIGASDTESTRSTLRLFGASEVAAGLALLVITARRLGRQPAGTRQRRRRIQVEQVVTINRSLDEVYGFWRNFANFPRFMAHLERVEVLGDRLSRWTATAPAGMTVRWDAEIIQDREGEWLAWRSLAGSQVENSGSVRFAPAPGARGTEVRVQLEYVPPAGQVGRLVAMLFGEEPRQQVREDLRRFKQLMEAGEISTSEGPRATRIGRPERSAATSRQDFEEVHA